MFKLHFFTIIVFILFACSNDPSSPSSNIATKKVYKPDDSTVKTPSAASWRNPVMSPWGADVGRIIRGYYLVGDYQKMLQFVIIPPCYTRKQIEYILRKSKWGYDIKMDNLQWMEDSTFLMNYRSTKQNTYGVEQYAGRIINDTAKLFLFPKKENLFQYYGEEDLKDICQ